MALGLSGVASPEVLEALRARRADPAAWVRASVAAALERLQAK